MLNKYGYHYRQVRRKGLLTKNDLKLRMKSAKDITKYYDDGLLLSGMCFYLDAKRFIHKLLNLQKVTLLRFSEVVAALQGMCLFKMVTQVKTPKLLELPQTRSVLYRLV